MSPRRPMPSFTPQNHESLHLVDVCDNRISTEGCYGSTRDEVVDIVERLLRVKQLRVQDAEVVWQAIRVFRNGKAVFADCLIEREGSAHGCDHTTSFDKTAVKAAGMVQLA